MKKINLLYYSKALNANHGGRYHSEAFLKESKINVRTDNVYSFPEKDIEEKVPLQKKEISDNRLRNILKKNSLFQIFSFLRLNWLSFIEITSIIESYDIDAIHIRMTRNFFILKRLKKRYPKLVISTEVNASPFDESFKNIAFKSFFRNQERQSLYYADCNFFVSSYLREKIMGMHNTERDYVVHNGVHLDMFKELVQKELSKEALVFGYIGTLDFHKNLETLFDAFKIVIVNYPSKKLKLILVGDGPMANYLKSYVDKIGLNEYVEFTGWINHNNIPIYLKRMDVAVHHSANPYMSPLKIFEYMAIGLPVIGPDIPAVNEILTNNEDILLVQNQSEDIADKMMILINDLDLRAKISENGKIKIRNFYGWSHNAENILSVIQRKYHNKAI